MQHRSSALRPACLAVLALLATSAHAQTTVPIDVDFRGLPAGGYLPGYLLGFSGNGRFAAITATRPLTENAPLGAAPSSYQAFRRDLSTGELRFVALGIGGTWPDSIVHPMALTSDGSGCLVLAAASNLVFGDAGDDFDVFFADVATGAIERLSLGLGGSEPNGDCYASSMSSDGRFVAIDASYLANNMFPGDNNGASDVLLRDRITGANMPVSVDPNGAPGSAESFNGQVSADGRFVAFASDASNLVPGDTNATTDLFVRDMATGATVRASVGPAGSQADGPSRFFSLAANGRYLVFTSSATNLVANDTNGMDDVFLRDLVAGTTTRVSEGPGGVQSNGESTVSVLASVSADGRYCVFLSTADNLTPGDANGSIPDAFLYDRVTSGIELISRSSSLVQGNGPTTFAVISPDGRRVGFQSDATNLAIGAGNHSFLHDRAPGSVAPPQRYCTAKVNSAGCTPAIGLSGSPSVSGDDGFVVATRVLPRKSGMLFWGTAPQAIPFGGGWMCVQGPVHRTQVQDSGGPVNSPWCVGAYSFQFSAAYLLSSGAGVGTTVHAQYWSRDPAWPVASERIGLTDAVQFTVAP